MQTKSRFETVRGSLIEVGDYISFDGIWYRVDGRIATAAEGWSQKFRAMPRQGSAVEIVVRYWQDYFIYRGNTS